MSLHTIISTGRGGAGNMIDSKFGPSTSNPGAEIDDSANEVIMTQEEFDRFNSKCNNHHHGLHNHGYHGKRSNCGKIVEPVITEGKTYHHDKNGKIFASSGRGGAGNIAKFDKVPTAKIESEKQEIELSPVFSTGRGGAGNIYRTKSHTKTKIPLNTEITDQLSPLHSNRSGKSGKSSRSTENPIEPIHETKESNKFMKKFKTFFNYEHLDSTMTRPAWKPIDVTTDPEFCEVCLGSIGFSTPPQPQELGHGLIKYSRRPPNIDGVKKYTVY